MIWQALFGYFHLLAAGLAGGLKLAEHWMLSRPPDRLQIRLLGTARMGYLLALIAALATGLGRLRDDSFGEPPDLANPLFLLKMGLFGLLLLLALLSTGLLLRWNREARSAPTFTLLTADLETGRATVALELGLLALLPLPAVLLARGFGL